MTTRKFSSISVETTLASGISNSATTMTVATGTGSALLGGVTITSGDQFTVALDVDTQNEEIVFITAVSGDTFTITRGGAGTSAISHSGGASVKHVLTSDDLNAFQTAVSPVTSVTFAGSTSGTLALQSAATASGTVTIPAGTATLVTTSATQTLTNKTLTAPTISTITNTGTITLPTLTDTLVSRTATETLTNKDLSSSTNIYPSTLVTTTATQTLTNKTLTSPALTTPSISNINAKGDVLVGTADDTLGVLSLGTNDFVLTADSSTSTGLKWASAPSPSYSWTDFTPTVTQGTSVTVTTNWAKYVDVGPLRFIDVKVTTTSVGTLNSDISVTLPASTFASTGGIYGTATVFFTGYSGATGYVPGLVESTGTNTIKFQQAHVAAATGQYIGDADGERLQNNCTITFSLVARK